MGVVQKGHIVLKHLDTVICDVFQHITNWSTDTLRLNNYDWIQLLGCIAVACAIMQAEAIRPLGTIPYVMSLSLGAVVAALVLFAFMRPAYRLGQVAKRMPYKSRMRAFDPHGRVRVLYIVVILFLLWVSITQLSGTPIQRSMLLCTLVVILVCSMLYFFACSTRPPVRKNEYAYA